MKKMLLALMILTSAASFANTKVKTQEVLTGDQVLAMLNTAFKEAKDNKLNVSITIVDKAGRRMGLIRTEDSGVHTVDASYKKAYTAASLKNPTLEIGKRIQEGKIPSDLKYLDENFTTVEGGLPIKINGTVVGGIGVGGARSDQDAQIATKALETLDKITK